MWRNRFSILVAIVAIVSSLIAFFLEKDSQIKSFYIALILSWLIILCDEIEIINLKKGRN